MSKETIAEMLQELPIGLTRAGFYDLCRGNDSAIADEAWRRYSDQGLAARRPRQSGVVERSH